MMAGRKAKSQPQRHDYADKSRGIRLQKAIADAGVASRRASEEFITAGRVRVNGQIVHDLPAWVDPVADRIEVDGQPIQRPRKHKSSSPKTYVLLNKPRRVICTNDDPQGRTRAIDLIDAPLAAHGKTRLFPVGRLDADSTGLLLLTNDGELTNRLTHPRYQIPKQYQVKITGRLSENDLSKLRDGLLLAHKTKSSAHQPKVKRAAVEKVVILGYEHDKTRGDRTTLAITLREGQNREIRRLLARLGYRVRHLKRTAIGPLKLKGLAVGQWRLLTNTELKMLQKAAGIATKSQKPST